MSSWKQIITSGSNAVLNTVNATSFIGPLNGTASWAISSSRAITASFAISSSYALSASYSPSSVTINNNTDNNIITATGTTSLNGEANFTFNGTTAYISGALGVGTSTPTTIGLIRATNDVIAFYSSDERLKTNKKIISNSIEIIQQLNGYKFTWIPKKGIHENKGKDIGVIAQEVEKVLPEIVVTRDNGYKAVKYEKIIAVLIEAVKELNNKIEILEEKINKNDNT
jgi:hypothetical protein